jgi:uncharacterized protein (TIGR00251 family)
MTDAHRPPIRETANGVEIDVRVIPRARRSELAGIRDTALLCRLAAPPVEGAANAALVELLSHHLRLPRESIRIVRGARARSKRVAVAGIAPAAAARLLGLQF